MAAGPGTGQLPKATVKLGQTQPMARPGISAPQAAPVKRGAAAMDTDSFYEEKDPEAGLVPLSVIGLVFSIALLVVQMFSTDTVMTTPAGQPSPLMVPADQRVDWEAQDAVGAWRNNFQKAMPAIPE